MAKIGLLGHGVVGSGVAQILFDNAELFQARTGQKVELVRVSDLRDFDVPYASLFTKHGEEVADDPQIDIVVECMGGVEPAFSFLARALRNKKHIVTSNKELVVQKGTELAALARENGVNFFYEASVGGGIPILRPLRQCLSANHVERIMGILNGTTNYILTRMKDGGVAFDVALKEAQDLGYAERDPSADVLGWDARRKICILSHVAFGAPLDDSRIPCQGITNLTREDMIYAKELGRVIKLLAVSCRTPEGYYAFVSPAMIPLGHPLSVVSDVFNAIMVRGDMLGDAMFYGRGAGKLPTASAVCADIIDAVWHLGGVKAADSYVGFAQPQDADGSLTRLFVRFAAPQESEAEQLVRAVMPQARVVHLRRYPDEFAVITQEDSFGSLNEQIDRLSDRVKVIQRLRYEV